MLWWATELVAHPNRNQEVETLALLVAAGATGMKQCFWNFLIDYLGGCLRQRQAAFL